MPRSLPGTIGEFFQKPDSSTPLHEPSASVAVKCVWHDPAAPTCSEQQLCSKSLKLKGNAVLTVVFQC